MVEAELTSAGAKRIAWRGASTTRNRPNATGPSSGTRIGATTISSYEEVDDLGSKAVARRKKRGPKTPKGRLAVRLNASTHGILSAQPVVGAYERAEDWESHREVVVGSLSPEGGMEQVLAERVALCSWRLNRVVLYESERVSELQEGVTESVREKRKRRLEVAQL